MRTATLAALAAASLSLTACGADDGTGRAGPTAAQQQKARDALVKFARCMRANGVDIPDPRTAEDGTVNVLRPGPGAQGRAEIAPAKFERAEKACAKYREALPRPRLSEEQRREFREAALAHAKCMREHGVDFPDPQFGEGGEAFVRIGPGAGAIDPDRPAFRRADEACRHELPGGGRGGVRRVGP